MNQEYPFLFFQEAGKEEIILGKGAKKIVTHIPKDPQEPFFGIIPSEGSPFFFLQKV